MSVSFPHYVPKNPFNQPRFLRSLYILRGVILSLVAIVPVLFANVVQMIVLIFIRPFSAKTFRSINRWLANTYWGLLVFLTETVNGIEPIFTGDKLIPEENAMIISNHQNIADIPAIMSLAKRYSRLGDMKWFVKDIIKYIPGPGWGMLFLDCIFLKRNWLSDKTKIRETFKNIVDYDVSIWLISFLEGTRITPEKLKRSQEFAKRRKLPPTEYTMIPRTKGFVASLQGLEGHLDAVYSITIGYPDGIPSLWQMMLGDVKRFAIDVRRFAVSDLPKEEKALEQWTLEEYRIKDSKVKQLEQTGSFPGERTSHPN